MTRDSFSDIIVSLCASFSVERGNSSQQIEVDHLLRQRLDRAKAHVQSVCADKCDHFRVIKATGTSTARVAVQGMDCSKRSADGAPRRRDFSVSPLLLCMVARSV